MGGIGRLLALIWLSSAASSQQPADWFKTFLSDVASADSFAFKPHHIGKHLSLVASAGNKTAIAFSCQALFHSHANANATEYRPRQPPAHMVNSYSLDGAISMLDLYCAEEKQNGGAGYHWAKGDLESMGSRPCACGQYKKPVCDQVISKYGHLIKDKTGYVFGTQVPWAEAALLAAGATITTVEYMSIETDHPRLSYIHPFNLTRQFLRGHHDGGDFAWSFSSLEHDGLGRYGDPVSPFADLESIYRIHCLLKPGGVLFLGLPVGPDSVFWNAHRIYGPLRLRLVTSGWELLDVLGLERRITSRDRLGDYNHQPILVLKKPAV